MIVTVTKTSSKNILFTNISIYWLIVALVVCNLALLSWNFLVLTLDWTLWALARSLLWLRKQWPQATAASQIHSSIFESTKNRSRGVTDLWSTERDKPAVLLSVSLLSVYICNMYVCVCVYIQYTCPYLYLIQETAKLTLKSEEAGSVCVQLSYLSKQYLSHNYYSS